MSTREAELRHTIVADHDNDELPLVYADYWEEAGEPVVCVALATVRCLAGSCER